MHIHTFSTNTFANNQIIYLHENTQNKHDESKRRGKSKFTL